MSGPSLEEFGGVLAAPRISRRTVITAAVIALALVAASLGVVVSRLVAGPAGLIATLDFGQSATSVAFSPDSTTIAVLDSDGSTHLWDVATGQQTTTLPPGRCHGGADNEAEQVLFSPDGKTLAVIGGGSNGSITCLWDITTRQQTATLTDPRPAGAFAAFAQGGAFSPDGRMLAIGDADGSTYVWDVATRRLAATLNDPTVSIDDGVPADVVAVAYGPGGTTLVAGDSTNGPYVWDVATRRIIANPTGPGDGQNSSGGIGVTSLASSTGGKVLAVGDGSGEACVWDLATVHMLSCFTMKINVLEMNPSYYCQPCDQGGELIPGGPGPIPVSVALSPDGKTLAARVQAGNGTYLWDVATRHLIATVNDPGTDDSNPPGPSLFSPNGKLLAIVDTGTGRTYVWQVSSLGVPG